MPESDINAGQAVYNRTQERLFSKDQHRLLMSWAYDCSWHVLPSFGKTIDECLHHALEEATAWKAGEVTVGKDKETSARELVLTARRIKKTSYNDYQEII